MKHHAIPISYIKKYKNVQDVLQEESKSQPFTSLYNLVSGLTPSTQIQGYPGRVNSYKDKTQEGNAKCRHLQKLTCKATLLQVFIFLRPITRLHRPYTLYTCIQYTILAHTQRGREGGELNKREG
jgi:hypothetical protein